MSQEKCQEEIPRQKHKIRESFKIITQKIKNYLSLYL